MKNQVPKTKSEINTNDQNSKFKTGKMIAENLIIDQNILVIGISGLNIICNLRIDIWNLSGINWKRKKYKTIPSYAN